MSVHELKRPTAKPDPDILRLCRHLLQQAEAGELRAVAVAIDLSEDATAHAMAYAKGSRPVALVGAIELLKLQALDLAKQSSV